jgi:hypothetical protein
VVTDVNPFSFFGNYGNQMTSGFLKAGFTNHQPPETLGGLVKPDYHQ